MKQAGLKMTRAPYAVTDHFDFFNPKVGLSYTVAQNSVLYGSYAIANREPNRTDYLDGTEKPKSERLGNLELGWRKTTQKYGIEANYYLMNYVDQLVLTGAISDVGAPIRANVGRSYRTGIELSGLINFTEQIELECKPDLER